MGFQSTPKLFPSKVQFNTFPTWVATKVNGLMRYAKEVLLDKRKDKQINQSKISGIT